MTDKITNWIFLRGLGRDARHWGRLIDVFKKEFPKANVILPDLPGSGKRYKETSPLTIKEVVGALKSELPKNSKSNLVAISMGGMVAVEWLRQSPSGFAGAVLINSSLGRFNRFFERLRFSSLPEMLKIGASQSPRVREEFILKLTSTRDWDESFLQERAKIAEKWAMTRTNLLRQLISAANYRSPSHAPAVPLLILTSDRDRLVNPVCSLELSRRWGAELHRHPTAGHDLPLDDPDWVVKQIKNWSDSLSSYSMSDKKI